MASAPATDEEVTSARNTIRLFDIDIDVVTMRESVERLLRWMDAPRTSSVRGAEERPLARWMISREQEYYGRFDPPDLLIVLRVSPDSAVDRRPDQDPDFVRIRAQEVWDRDWNLRNCVVIDADRHMDGVHDDVRRAVWSML